MSKKLYAVKLSTDRRANRAVSPIGFSELGKLDRPVVVVHPGWGKRPEIFRSLLSQLADAGTHPIGVDTRFGYSDRYSRSDGVESSKPQSHKPSRYYQVGNVNPFFEQQSVTENRYRLRRPTGLVAMLAHLGIREAALFGHSEGGRVTATVAAESIAPLHITKLVIANAVGTGPNKGARGMASSNFTNNEFYQGHLPYSQAVLSSISSTTYALTHPRRFLREKQVINQAATTTWKMLDIASIDKGIDVTVLHAREDKLISYPESEIEAQKRPHIAFIPTDGGHSNVYTPTMTDRLTEILAA